ncbi:hypothetical protein VaNZ11_003376, partial [Volvox africanus]
MPGAVMPSTVGKPVLPTLNLSKAKHDDQGQNQQNVNHSASSRLYRNPGGSAGQAAAAAASMLQSPSAGSSTHRSGAAPSGRPAVLMQPALQNISNGSNAASAASGSSDAQALLAARSSSSERHNSGSHTTRSFRECQAVSATVSSAGPSHSFLRHQAYNTLQTSRATGGGPGVMPGGQGISGAACGGGAVAGAVGAPSGTGMGRPPHLPSFGGKHHQGDASWYGQPEVPPPQSLRACVTFNTSASQVPPQGQHGGGSVDRQPGGHGQSGQSTGPRGALPGPRGPAAQYCAYGSTSAGVLGAGSGLLATPRGQQQQQRQQSPQQQHSQQHQQQQQQPLQQLPPPQSQQQQHTHHFVARTSAPGDTAPVSSRAMSFRAVAGAGAAAGAIGGSGSANTLAASGGDTRVTIGGGVGGGGNRSNGGDSSVLGSTGSSNSSSTSSAGSTATTASTVTTPSTTSSSGGGAAVTWESGYITPAQALGRYSEYMTPYEHSEVLEYQQIYFVGRSSAQKVSGCPLNARSNCGYDDERGDYTVVLHDHLAYRFEVLSVMGRGSFGQVVKVHDFKTNSMRAIKVIRNKKRFHQQALVELRVLQNIRDSDPEDNNNCVHIGDHFYFRNHLCINFELLSINLYDFIKQNNFMGLNLGLIRRFAHQILVSLRYMKQLRLIHCDLKPENILLRQPNRSAIKVIDFGSSCYVDERIYTYIQSRFYRSPEVILGAPYGVEIDMWSLGCILAELYTGYPLFPGEDEVEQLACIMEVSGSPPKELLDAASRRKLFFDSGGNPRLQPNSQGRTRMPGSKTLQAILKCNDPGFLDLLEKLLRWDPATRITPDQALQHVWIMDQNPSPTSSRVGHPAGANTASSCGGSADKPPLPPPPQQQQQQQTVTTGAPGAAALSGTVAAAIASKQQQQQPAAGVTTSTTVATATQMGVQAHGGAAGKAEATGSGGSSGSFRAARYDPIGAAAAAAMAVAAASAASAAAAAASAGVALPRMSMTDSAMGHHASGGGGGFRHSKRTYGSGGGGGGSDDGVIITVEAEVASHTSPGPTAGGGSRGGGSSSGGGGGSGFLISNRSHVVFAGETQVPGLGSTVLTSAPPPLPVVPVLDFSALRGSASMVHGAVEEPPMPLSTAAAASTAAALLTPRGQPLTASQHHLQHQPHPPAVQLRSDGAALCPTLISGNSPRNAGGGGAVSHTPR